MLLDRKRKVFFSSDKTSAKTLHNSSNGTKFFPILIAYFLLHA